MAFKLREAYPSVRRIDTENAGSNANARYQRRNGVQANPDPERLAGEGSERDPGRVVV